MDSPLVCLYGRRHHHGTLLKPKHTCRRCLGDAHFPRERRSEQIHIVPGEREGVGWVYNLSARILSVSAANGPSKTLLGTLICHGPLPESFRPEKHLHRWKLMDGTNRGY